MAKTIQQELRAAFEAKQKAGEMTYQRLADALDIDRASAFRKINGSTSIDSGEELAAFAKALSVKVSVKGAV